MDEILRSALRPAVAAFTLTVGYRAYIESMRTLLKTHPGTELVTVGPELGHRYRGDLTLLLIQLGVQVEDHYLVMRVNDLTSIHAVDEHLAQLYIPSRQFIDQIKAVWKNAQ